ncbi:MAG: molybdenum ABC transporter ATP-binding protein [Gammaproteobacteria bacterium]|nr:molybdenum ABC transporter ATP-binding protein [Gammaproteobacteria bacterium]|tara:strand:- start:259 stop:1326 length:1068 start_codon:yes stop_codon:yes gene_type:complete
MTLKVRAQLQRGDFRLDVDTSWPAQGVTALFGRSGCGKTTLLRIIAGLERVRGAQVWFGDACWQDGAHWVPVEKRRLGLVFQEASLLPHLSVTGNLLYGYKRTPLSLRRLQLPDVSAMLGLESLLSRPVDALSGGQKQRVALGRALLCSPQQLLLDEPLAALDTQTKREIMPFLSRLAQASGIPMVLITHAPDEVQRLADRVVFMGDGGIDEQCSLQQALAKPDSPLFADEGPSSVLVGELGAADAHGTRLFGPVGSQLRVQAPDDTNAGPTRLRVLARDVSVALDDPARISIRNHLVVTIRQLHDLPDNRVLLDTVMQDGQTLLIEITPWSAQQLELAAGQRVFALIKTVALMR